MIERLQQWQDKLNSLSLRERVLVMLVMAGVVILLLQLILIDPLLKSRSSVQSRFDQLTQAINQQRREKTLLETQLAVGVNRDNLNRRDQLLKQREQLDQQIQETVVAMIPPKLMPHVLEDLLAQSGDLTLLSLDDRPAVSMIEKTAGEQEADDKTADSQVTDNDNKQALYKHAFVLRLQGSYPAAIAYFEKLSQLPWRFHWDDLLYQVDQYPSATITLEVYTVSMSEEWLGV